MGVETNPNQRQFRGIVSNVFRSLQTGLDWGVERNPEKSQMFGKIVVNP
jgi:hypothetical protein